MKRLMNIAPSRGLSLLLGLLPFVVLLLIYLISSEARLNINENDKLLPSLEQMFNAMQRMVLEPSRRTGDYLFWTDTFSSLQRLAMGIGIAASLGLVIGMVTGILPLATAGLSPLLTVVSLVPPLALLPILFIVFGLGEVSKVALIVIGITPIIAREILRRTQEIPNEQLVKAQTLGASTAQIMIRVLLPQLFPKLIDAVRLSMGAGWLFLISAEAIASTDGLGYRIFLVRRYMSMDVIIPYVVWITLLAFLLDYGLRQINHRLFPWHR